MIHFDLNKSNTELKFYFTKGISYKNLVDLICMVKDYFDVPVDSKFIDMIKNEPYFLDSNISKNRYVLKSNETNGKITKFEHHNSYTKEKLWKTSR